MSAACILGAYFAIGLVIAIATGRREWRECESDLARFLTVTVTCLTVPTWPVTLVSIAVRFALRWRNP